MNNKIRHDGIIDSIEKECVHVRILQTSACAACKVAGYCNAAEAKEKIVDVYRTDVAHLKVGDPVVVSTSGDVVLVLWQTGDEGVAALSGLLALIPYYGLLFLLRHRMRRQMAFMLE